MRTSKQRLRPEFVLSARRNRWRFAARCGTLIFAAAASSTAWSYTYSCRDAHNQLQFSAVKDSPACIGRTQRELNGDGSLHRIIHPKLTDEEQAILDKCLERADLEAQEIKDLKRLRAKYPNETSLRKDHDRRVEDIKQRIARSEERIAKLLVERKPLTDDAEFYPGKKNMPLDLQRKLDASDASIAAQKDLLRTQQQELADFETQFSDQLDQLKKLWTSGVPQPKVFCEKP